MSKSKRQQGTAWWWAAIVIVLITLIGPVAEVLEAQQFPVPATRQVPAAESQQFSGATGTVQPDQRFANGGVIGAEGVVSNESGRKMLQALGRSWSSRESVSGGISWSGSMRRERSQEPMLG